MSIHTNRQATRALESMLVAERCAGKIRDLEEQGRIAKSHELDISLEAKSGTLGALRDSASLSGARMGFNVNVDGDSETIHSGNPVTLKQSNQDRHAVHFNPPGNATNLQPITVSALQRATPFFWTSESMLAASQASESLPDNAGWTDRMFREIGSVGYWFFDKPVSIQTTSTPAEKEPVIALLWEYQQVAKPLSKNQKDWDKTHPQVWFTTFIHPKQFPQHDLRGKPVPTTSFAWPLGLTIGDMQQYVRASYLHCYPDMSEQEFSDGRWAGMQVTLTAALWMTRFWLASMAWLQQRVLTTQRTGSKPLNTGKAKRLRREHNLSDFPAVEVVNLRRAAPSTDSGNSEGKKRDYQCQWVVHGHWRNQYYAKQKIHQPKWIDAYIKGPKDKPLKDATRVFAVNR